MIGDEVLVRGREFAESRMGDTCLIRRVTGETVVPDTFEVVPTYAVVYEGPCRFQQSDIDPTQTVVGEDYVLLQRMQVQLPTAAAGFAVDDEVECVTSRHDPDLPGRVFVVRALAHKSEATTRRLQLRERTD